MGSALWLGQTWEVAAGKNCTAGKLPLGEKAFGKVPNIYREYSCELELLYSLNGELFEIMLKDSLTKDWYEPNLL